MIVYITLNDNWIHGGQKLVAPDLSAQLCDLVHSVYFLKKTASISSEISNWLSIFGKNKIAVAFEPTLLFQRPGAGKRDRIYGVDGMTFAVTGDKVELLTAGYGPMPQ